MRRTALYRLCALLAALHWAYAHAAQSAWMPTASASASYGPELQGFEYPSPVSTFEFSSQGQSLHMRYMDVRPEKGNGRAVVLLHGKNY